MTKATKEKISTRPEMVVHAGKGRCRRCYGRENARVRYGWEPRKIAVIDENGIWCPKCEEHLPFADFEQKAELANGYRSCCKTCALLQYCYNITKKTYKKLLEQQDHRCAICRRHSSEFNQNLCVDHDHTCCPGRAKSCGKCVRGLLCQPCNQGLGLFRDSIEALQNAINYLKD